MAPRLVCQQFVEFFKKKIFDLFFVHFARVHTICATVMQPGSVANSCKQCWKSICKNAA